MLKKVDILRISDLITPQFIKPQLVSFTRDGDTMEWETIKTHDSVHILVENREDGTLIFVKQVRVPVLARNPGTDGVVVECCAGIIDKYPELEESERAHRIAREEIREELGYDTLLSDIKPVKQLKSSVGTSGSTAHAFYAEVKPENFIGQQTSIFEDIEVVEIMYSDVEEYLAQADTDPMTMFLATWWLRNFKGNS